MLSFVALKRVRAELQLGALPAAKKVKPRSPTSKKMKKRKRSTTIIDGVGEFGGNRWGRAVHTERWSPARGDDAAKFWIIMFVLTFVPMRVFIGIRKLGRARMAADGLRSYEIAFFMMDAALTYFGIDSGTTHTPLGLYTFGACVR